MEINIKRVYDTADETDGVRVLVGRLWPRGLSKSAANVDTWVKGLAPSTQRGKWYSHDPAKRREFKQRDFAELEANSEGVERLVRGIRGEKVTLLYGSKEPDLNNAVALKEYLASRF